MKQTIIGGIGVIAVLALLTYDGGTSFIVAENSIIHIQQGPDWLVMLLYNPPWWVEWAGYAVTLSCIGLAYLGYQQTDIDNQIVAEMARNAIIVLGAAVVTIALVNYAALPYIADVVIGGVSGWLLGQLGYHIAIRNLLSGNKNPG